MSAQYKEGKEEVQEGEQEQNRTSNVRLNSEKFKPFILKPKLSLLRENHKNDKSNDFLDFNEFTL